MKVEIACLKWEEIAQGHGYLYGSMISFEKGKARFQNRLVASGKSIVTFFSDTNYQQKRRSPDLPLLQPGQTYHIRSDIETVPLNRYFLQLLFFNRQGEKISFEIIRETEAFFTYPKEAYTYELHVKSAGCDSMVFGEIALYQDLAEEQESLVAASYRKDSIPEDLLLVANLIRTQEEGAP